MRVVVQRYSALGDIMMLLPILQAAKEQNPEMEIALVSRSFLAPLFNKLDLDFIPAELNGRHKGLFGLYRLANEIHYGWKPDLLVDAHDVLRSKVIDKILGLRGLAISKIEKNREERKALSQKKDKVFKAITPVYELYLKAFADAGLKIDFDPKKPPLAPYKLNRNMRSWWLENKAPLNIGIAPTAKHRAKQWPLEKMQYFMQSVGINKVKLFLFGGREERAELETLGKKSGANFQVVAGEFPLDQEIALIKELDYMVSMDSSNMHLASWAGTKVISIWGATHPHAGFKGYGQSDLNCIGIPHRELGCRPCSVFGNKECWRGDYACLEQISHERVRDHLNQLISESQ